MFTYIPKSARSIHRRRKPENSFFLPIINSIEHHFGLCGKIPEYLVPSPPIKRWLWRSVAMPTTTIDDLRSTLWAGSIPVVLSLAQTSLSSPTMPPPIHALVPRHTYLHVGLRSATRRFHKFAPPVISFPITRSEPNPGETCEEQQQLPGKPTFEDSYPVCWFEDEETHTALRWHLFAGVLWDMKQQSKSIPWKIKIHFNNYPSSQILPMEVSHVLTVVERTFKNSLKQALFLQQGSTKVAMNMSKQSYEQLWESILTSNFQLYQQVDNDLQSVHNMLPIRLMIDAKPPIQRPLRVTGTYHLAIKESGWVRSLS